MARYMVDTSVWIDFFKGTLKPHILANLAQGIRDQEVVISDIIRHEILVGSKSRDDYKALATLLRTLNLVRIDNEDVDEFDWFAWQTARKGLLGKYTDISIAYLCHKNHWPLLTFDSYFGHLEKAGLIQTIKF